MKTGCRSRNNGEMHHDFVAITLIDSSGGQMRFHFRSNQIAHCRQLTCIVITCIELDVFRMGLDFLILFQLLFERRPIERMIRLGTGDLRFRSFARSVSRETGVHLRLNMFVERFSSSTSTAGEGGRGSILGEFHQMVSKDQTLSSFVSGRAVGRNGHRGFLGITVENRAGWSARGNGGQKSRYALFWLHRQSWFSGGRDMLIGFQRWKMVLVEAFLNHRQFIMKHPNHATNRTTVKNNLFSSVAVDDLPWFTEISFLNVHHAEGYFTWIVYWSVADRFILRSKQCRTVESICLLNMTCSRSLGKQQLSGVFFFQRDFRRLRNARHKSTWKAFESHRQSSIKESLFTQQRKQVIVQQSSKKYLRLFFNGSALPLLSLICPFVLTWLLFRWPEIVFSWSKKEQQIENC